MEKTTNHLLEIARLCQRRGEFDQAAAHFEQVVALARQQNEAVMYAVRRELQKMGRMVDKVDLMVETSSEVIND